MRKRSRRRSRFEQKRRVRSLRVETLEGRWMLSANPLSHSTARSMGDHQVESVFRLRFESRSDHRSFDQAQSERMGHTHVRPDRLLSQMRDSHRQHSHRQHSHRRSPVPPIPAPSPQPRVDQADGDSLLPSANPSGLDPGPAATPPQQTAIISASRLVVIVFGDASLNSVASPPSTPTPAPTPASSSLAEVGRQEIATELSEELAPAAVPKGDQSQVRAGRQEIGDEESVRLTSLVPTTATPTLSSLQFDAAGADRESSHHSLPASPQAAYFERWLDESEDLKGRLQTLDRVFESLSTPGVGVESDHEPRSVSFDRGLADRSGQTQRWLDDFGSGMWLLSDGQDVAPKEIHQGAEAPEFEGWDIGIGFFGALQISDDASSDLAAALTSITASPAHLATSPSAANLVSPSSPLSESDGQHSGKLTLRAKVALGVITITLLAAGVRRDGTAWLKML